MSAPSNQNAKQPKTFAFTPANLAEAKKIMAKYPAGREASAVIPLLDLAQRQHANWLPIAAMDVVADMLRMPRVKVYEVASFYTMFNRAPVGKHLLQVCTTTPCWLCGSGALMKVCKDKLGLEGNDTTKDGMFSLMEVECLGACVNAPMVQVNDDYYEDLTAETFSRLLDDLAAGKKIKIGSQTGRQGSAKMGHKR
ncbi:MAG: NADH-quinone oxidoreductase subunit NuoE [Proteobacteria bacterium]|nr:NADH-quinone oxidoreductase subunit NuoE [Pseudomonadota bacterium]